MKMDHSHYHSHMSDLAWRRDDRGNWQGSMRSIQLQVPLQTPIPHYGKTVWRLPVKDLHFGEIPQCGRAKSALSRGGDLDLWMDTIHYGQGRVELLQITEAMNGRFAVANTGDLVDQNPAYWLLEKDFGNYLRMGPLNIEGIGNSAGLQLIIRNLLPW
ncbi:MAG: hypothetical protein OXC82_10015, partial [Rhodobacteraceae bacterium]|nr:hypothetical protein [Paracoccaceae bacterium]